MQYNYSYSNTLKKIGVYKLPLKPPLWGYTIFWGWGEFIKVYLALGKEIKGISVRGRIRGKEGLL